MKTKIMCIAWLLVVTGAHAQSTKHRNELGFSYGWQRVKFNDQHASPLTYAANAKPFLGLFYNHQSDKSIFHLKLSGAKGTANPTRFGARDYRADWNDSSFYQYQVSSEFINANLEASYLRRLGKSPNGKLDYWAGATVNESAYYGDEIANFNWINNAVDFSPAFQMNYNASSTHQFKVAVDFAAISLVTRTVYGLFAKSSKDKNVMSLLKQGSEWTPVNKGQKINVKFGYTYYAFKRVNIGADYQLRWFHYSNPKPIKAIDSRINLNVSYLFK